MGLGETQLVQYLEAADLESADLELFCSPIFIGAIPQGSSVLDVTPIESQHMTLKYLSMQTFALSATVWPEFQWQLRPPKLDASFIGSPDHSAAW